MSLSPWAVTSAWIPPPAILFLAAYFFVCLCHQCYSCCMRVERCGCLLCFLPSSSESSYLNPIKRSPSQYHYTFVAAGELSGEIRSPPSHTFVCTSWCRRGTSSLNYEPVPPSDPATGSFSASVMLAKRLKSTCREN